MPPDSAPVQALRRLCMDNSKEMKVFFNSFSYSNSSRIPKSDTNSSLRSLIKSSISFKICESSFMVKSSKARPFKAWLKTRLDERGKFGRYDAATLEFVVVLVVGAQTSLMGHCAHYAIPA